MSVQCALCHFVVRVRKGFGSRKASSRKFDTENQYGGREQVTSAQTFWGQYDRDLEQPIARGRLQPVLATSKTRIH